MIGLGSRWRSASEGVDSLLAEALAEACDALHVASDRPEPLVEYQGDPVAFADEVLGVPANTLRWSINAGYEEHAWDGTKDPIAAMMDALARSENAAVESGTGTGKSFGLAIVILWFLACWDGARVFTFAPKEDQLRLYSWTELRKLWPRFKKRFPRAVLTDLRIRMIPNSDEWAAFGYPVGTGAGEDVSTKAQGMHAEHMLLIYEETPGINYAVLEAGENTCTDDHNLRLAVGNPDHQFDALHQVAILPDFTAIRASALDAPNYVTGRRIVPGAVGRKAVERREHKYTTAGRLYLSRVRGISPAQAADSLIMLEWLEEAARRYEDEEKRRELYARGLPGLGVDVANSEDGDEAAIARGWGAVLYEVSAFPCPDALQLGIQVHTEGRRMGVEDRHIGVDAVGVGASTVNKLKELGRHIPVLNSGAKAWHEIDQDLLEDEDVAVVLEEEFLNLRAMMWWRFRMDLFRGRIAIRRDAELFRDLVIPTWTTKNGKIVVQPKEEIIETLKRSPNKGDAAVYWNFVRRRRPVPEEEKPKGAFDPDVLAAEVEATRRVRNKVKLPYKPDPLMVAE